MIPPERSPWVALVRDALPAAAAAEWATTPRCGAVVTFLGVVRDHAEARSDVTGLTYEAYEEQAVRRLVAVAVELERRWPAVERVAVMHRLGDVGLSEASVLVAVGAPHRAEAFEAARFAIDTLKETVPIWKQEHASDGSEWSRAATSVRAVPATARSIPAAAEPRAERRRWARDGGG